MDWKSHLVLGVLSGIAASIILGLGLQQSLSFCFFAAIGALLPDIDARKSKISQLAAFAVVAVLLAAAFLWKDADGAQFALAAALAIAALLIADSFFRPSHRTVTHTPWFAALAAAACYWIAGWQTALAVVVGMLSHLAADGFPSGKRKPR